MTGSGKGWLTQGRPGSALLLVGGPSGLLSAVGAAPAGRSGTCSQQALTCPGATSADGGGSCEQTAIACGQRGWNRQPAGGASRLGTAPRPGAGAGPGRSGSGAALSRS